MKRRQPEAVTSGPPEFPDLGPMPICRTAQRSRVGLAYAAAAARPLRCVLCDEVRAFSDAIDDYYAALAEWRDQVEDVNPLDAVRAVGEQRRRVPDSPICHVEFP